MKKVYKILLIVLLIIIMNITVINATSTTPPASNASASEISNFWKDHKDENDEVWKSISAETIEDWLDTLSNSKSTNNAGVNAAIVSTTNGLKKIWKEKRLDKGTKRTQNVFKDDVTNNVGGYEPSNSSPGDDSEAATIISKILSLITSVGTVAAVLMLAILGVKYMLGSVEEKADYKKDMIPYLIGSILLFAICTIVGVLQTLGNTINNL